jgi:hypothetical protein
MDLPKRLLFLQKEPWSGDHAYQSYLIETALSLTGQHAYCPKISPFEREIDVFNANPSLLFWNSLLLADDVFRDNKNISVCFDEIAFSSGAVGGSWNFEKNDASMLRKAALTKSHASSSFKKQICVNQRILQRTRYFVNLGEIVIYLMQKYKRDVKVFSYEDKTVHEQATVINDCALVIHPHGGGMTNIMFMEPNTTVVEIFPFRYAPTWYYSELARSCGVNISMIVSTRNNSFFVRQGCEKFDFHLINDGDCSSNVTCHWCYKDSTIRVDLQELESALVGIDL